MDPQALGRYLRESRDAKERTLEDAVAALRIRRSILESFEQGDFSVVESPVQVRGLLRNYARYLNLEEEKVLQYYEAALQSRDRRKPRRGKRDTQPVVPVAPRRITDTPPSFPSVSLADQRDIRSGRGRNLLSSVITGIFALAALGLIIFVTLDQLLPQEVSQEATPVATEVAIIGAMPTETYTPTWTPRAVEATPTQLFETGGFAGQGVLLRVQTTQRTWLRVTVDDVDVFTGVMAPGDDRSFEGNAQVQLVASNAAALNLTYNGQLQPPSGERGQQAAYRFTETAIELLSVPTAQPTLTPLFQVAAPETPTPFSLGQDAAPLLATQPAQPDAQQPDLQPVETLEAAAPAQQPGAQEPGPSPTPLNTLPPTEEPTAIPTIAPSETPTPTMTLSPTVTLTPTITQTPSPTAILPPRVTPTGLPDPKAGA